jgi:hypothetical protein
MTRNLLILLLILLLVPAATLSQAVVNHYLYVFVPGSIYVYDMDNNMALVKQKPFAPTATLSAVHIRGAVSSAVTGMLYISYGSYGPGGGGQLSKYNVATDTIVWSQTYASFSIDNMSISPDGTKIYMPDGETSGNGNVMVIDAGTGNLLTTYTTAGTGPHNTWINPAGTHLYVGPRVSNQAFELNAATGATIQTFASVGTNFGNGVRPFTPDPTETYFFVTTSGIVEFFTQSVATGATLFTSVPPGFAHTGSFPLNGNNISGTVHGIEVSADGKYVWMIDLPGNAVHKFDVTGLPTFAPVDVADIHLSCTMTDEGWLTRSFDGRFIFVGDCGDVISTSTNAIVANAAQMLNTRIYTEIDLQSNTVVAGALTKNGTWNVPGPGVASANPASYAFGNVSTGSSPKEVITITNTGGVAFSMSAATVTGTNASDFTIDAGTTTCGTSVTTMLVGGTCTVGVIFTPSAIQSESATLNLNDTALNFPQTVNFTGAGVASTALTTCGTLGTANATYQLQNNVSSAGTCFTITANNVTLDLKGFTVTYDTGATASVNGLSAAGSVTGIHLTSSVAGGTIAESTACKTNVQTTSGGLCQSADVIAVGAHAEIDHLTLVDYGLDNRAIFVGSSGNSLSIHDNTLCPYHTKSTLTHFAVFGEIHVLSFAGVGSITNNTIGTACSSITGQPNGFGYVGIYMGAPGTQTSTLEITHNTISMAAPVRDGYAIEFGCSANTDINFEVAFNTITQVSGRGILAAGFIDQNSPGCNDGTIHDNVVSTKEAANEGFSQGDPLGIQLRFGAHNIRIFNNTISNFSGPGVCPAQFFTDTGSDCVSQAAIKLMGGSSAVNNQASNNTINSVTTSATFPVSGLYGDFIPPDSISGFFNNTVTSNGILTDMSQADGCGSGWNIKGNTFIAGANPLNFLTYHPWWFCVSPATTDNNIFTDNLYQGAGNNPDNINGPPSGGGNHFSYFVKWSYHVLVRDSVTAAPISGATVTAVATGGGSETVTGTTDATGNATLVLTDHSASGTSPSSPTRVNYTPHSITVSAPAYTSINYNTTVTGKLTEVHSLVASGQSPAATFSPASLDFGGIKIGLSSVSQSIVLTNTGTSVMNIASVGIAGTTPGDYSFTTTCGSTLAVSANCSVTITFTPIAIGRRNASVSVSSNTSTSPDTVPLSGVGFFPISGTGSVSGTGTVVVQP